MREDWEEQEQLPSNIETVDFNDPFTDVSLDKLSVKYTYSGVLIMEDHKAGMVQPEVPAPTNCAAYYFESYVNDAGVQGRIAIGFSTMGWLRTEGSKLIGCSYHGDNGFIYFKEGEDKTFKVPCQKYTTDDTVGCGINYASQEFFFTKNGSLVGKIPKVFTGNLYPTIALHSQNEEVTVNFKPEKFLFDLKGYRASVKEIQNMEIEKMSVPPNIALELVKSYLLHYGYEETLKAFDFATETETPGVSEQEISYSLQDRKNLREDCSKLLASENPEESDVTYLLSEAQREVVADAVNAAVLSSNPNNSQLHSRLEGFLRHLRACSYYCRR